jgi:SAM-dependent methyltransferase
MPDELSRFQITGPSWSERARAGELAAVLSPMSTDRRNRFLHSVNLLSARAARLLFGPRRLILDFGCGTGRFTRFFGERGYRVIGTEITPEMLFEARRFGVPKRSVLLQTDGVRIPLEDSSVDVIWCCGVLRFSLLVPDPVYRDIADEMFRILKPGGKVVNVEMYVDSAPEVFLRDFEAAGFHTRFVRVVQRYRGRLEKYSQSRWLPVPLVQLAGQFSAGFRLFCDNAWRDYPGLRDYLFVWVKP